MPTVPSNLHHHGERDASPNPASVPDPTPRTPWHALPADAAVLQLASDPLRGLPAADAAARLVRFGPNSMRPRPGRPWWLRLLAQFHAPLVYILLAAAAVTLFLGDYTDSAVILLVVLVNAVIGHVQESRAAGAIDALARSMRTDATVKRDGLRRRIDAADLVPGDVVSVEPGDKVPADLRLLAARDLRVDESMLTGESKPASKAPDPLPEGCALADHRDMAYAGTLVTRGTADGLVVATADATEVGKISEMISSAESVATPLTRKIAALSRLLLWAILAVAAATFAAGIARGYPPAQTFNAAVALAVAAVPEGLPAAVTIMLAVGVSRMARRHAIIRRLPAVEALGSTTVICSDKTGTLTRNQMTVQVAWTHPAAAAAADHDGTRYRLTGSGYDPSGQILPDPPPHRTGRVDANDDGRPALDQLLTCGALCNDASLLARDGRWEIQGDPTEAALVVSARKAGLTQESLADRLPRADAIPFDSARQYMATLHRQAGAAPAANRIVYLKGSVERVLAMSGRAMVPDGTTVPLDAATVHAAAASLARDGLRVLAFARLDLAGDPPDDLTHATVEHAPGGLTFLGLQAMLDPPRPEAIAAVASCRRAGVQVKMITGDHAITAATIAGMIGIGADPPAAGAHAGDAPHVLTGAEMAALPDDRLPALAEQTAVFARMTPEQKLRLVKALQARGHVVAMTGDGVNDAPALRQADIGVAMGAAGTEVAKDAADVVLADDNFASIEAAVEEGRSVFTNLTKFIVWTLPTNCGQGFVVLAAIALGWPLPVLPIHVLYVNTVTVVLLGMPLIFEAPEPGAMSRPPRDPRRPLLTRDLVMRTGFVSLLLCAGATGLFHWELARGRGEVASRTAAVSAIVVASIFYLFSSRALLRPAWSVPLSSNPWLWAGIAAMLATQFAFAHVPVIRHLFRAAPLDPAAWARVVAVGALLLAAVELEKALRRRRGNRHATPSEF